MLKFWKVSELLQEISAQSHVWSQMLAVRETVTDTG